MRYNDEDYFGIEREYRYPATYNKNAMLNIIPHYTDKRFDKEQTVFGKASKKLEYVYSDRIWQWDYAKAEEAAKLANESDFEQRSCYWYEVYLSHFFDQNIEIDHIIAGVNRSNGYPYAVFGYKVVS